ncbi:MAG: phenylacetate--CoA ligase family protein [Planctomycetota bacterium]
MGRPTFAYARVLESSQWESPVDIERIQHRKLRALLRHAGRNIPYYGTTFAELGLNPESQDPLDVLRSLPLLTKTIIKRECPRLIWRDCPGGLHPYNTGGSTGEPVSFFFDRRRQAYDQAARIRSHQWFGVDFGDREVYLWGSPIESQNRASIKRVRDRLLNQYLYNAFDMSPARIRECWEGILSIRPACLFGYPSSLALLAEHATGAVDAADWRPRAIFVTGEVCYPHHRKSLESTFFAPVADGYGSREAGFIAHQCPEGSMHITAENVFVEILKDGQEVDAGASGEIVITHLDTYGMPFIRYRTGDWGRLLPGRCRCGRGLPLMDVVAGRTTDFLYLPDGTIKHALSVIYPLRAIAGVRQFRVTQQEDMTVDVEFIEEPGASPQTGKQISARVSDCMGSLVKIRTARVEQIPPTGSGKYRYVVSHATAAQVAGEENHPHA